MRASTASSITRYAKAILAAELLRPQRPQALVICADRDGLSRVSLRNRKLIAVLYQARLATLLADLRTEEEQRPHAVEPDLASLASRLESITRRAANESDLRGLSIGYFAAATSAAVALRAAAVVNDAVHAVVSLDGHPDVAADLFGRITAATLLLVGSRDRDAIERNRRTARRLRCTHRVTVVDGAGSLFAEPGTLETAAQLAADWFTEHMTAARTAPATTNPMAAMAKER